MSENRGGFTIVEVIIAIVILSVGLLSVAAGSAATYKMLGSGRRQSQVAGILMQRVETLRRQANSTNPRCTGIAASGSATPSTGITESWTVTTSGSIRTVRIIVTWRRTRGNSVDTLNTVLECY